MDFELDHLEMVSTHHNQNPSEKNTESAILNELTQQIEDLQGKLKLSYRKLFLFETENQKLLKEKNFYFYEKNNFEEQYKMIFEKMKNLEKYSLEIETESDSLESKVKALEDLNRTQNIDLQRLTKFHAKITNIIKPHIAKLKSTIEKQTHELAKLQKTNAQYLELTEGLNKALEKQKADQIVQDKRHEFEKRNLISSYEEQIHFLSKEILEFQQKIAFAESENLRLKKSVETKSVIENDLIKFKRTHGDDQALIQKIKLKNHELEAKFASLQQEFHDLKQQNTETLSEYESEQNSLENTRRQLANQIQENEKLQLRIKMFERLNNHLSDTLNSPNP